jgi:hypothetical protein
VVAASTLSNVSAQVVDRFLATRKPGASSGPSCGCASPRALNEPAAAAKPAASTVTIADFVCEQDVRAALEGGRKIYIGPKTIVTPSARDMAAAHDMLVVAERA